MVGNAGSLGRKGRGKRGTKEEGDKTNLPQTSTVHA
jgi:hypothetical protein